MEADTEVYGTGGYARIWDFTEGPEGYEHCAQPMYTAQMAEFVDAIEEGRQPRPSGADGRVVMQRGRRGAQVGRRVTLVLGIDGGGTKTHALVADETGAVLGHATDGPSNWEAVGMRGAGDSLRDAMHKVLAAAERPIADVSGSVFGLAGVDWPSDVPRLESVIEPLGLTGPCRVLNDSSIALRAGTAGPGVVIIAGTGMVVAGRDANGRSFRTLGLGPPLGDVGSATDVAEAAVRAVADAYVGRGPATTLTEHLCSLTGARSVEELLENYSRGGEPTLLSAAPAVLRVAEDGDVVAMSIVTATGEHLGKSAAVVATRLQLEPGYDLVLAGGLFRSSSELLRSTLLEQVPGVQGRQPDRTAGGAARWCSRWRSRASRSTRRCTGGCSRAHRRSCREAPRRLSPSLGEQVVHGEVGVDAEHRTRLAHLLLGPDRVVREPRCDGLADAEVAGRDHRRPPEAAGEEPLGCPAADAVQRCQAGDHLLVREGVELRPVEVAGGVDQRGDGADLGA